MTDDEGYTAPDRPRRPVHETDDLLRAMGHTPASPPMYRAAQVANSLLDRAFDQFVKVSGVQLISAVRLVESEYLRRTGGRPLIEGTDSLTKYSRRRVIDEWITDVDGACLLAPEAHDEDLRAALDLVWAAMAR